ncbi:hypothetical protein Cgig2_026735 [Carnegiea gigantea]|uniref:GDSL esterase/lipase n=1 Tax=Carnegiea gigantea TaxID=171969 RepID=A0A9Q1JWB3_9CARY|nr:hypothetical protein Cgig2_026735 [Carnegiea gigantea]
MQPLLQAWDLWVGPFIPLYLEAGPRAFFVFGDSLVDNGNNNYLATSARADSPPYGIDYPTHRPTGRFSNGLNIPDIISEAIGSEPPMPYLSPEHTGRRLLVGANFASAGIGILNDTGVQFKIVKDVTMGVAEEESSCAMLRLMSAEKAKPKELESQANKKDSMKDEKD